MVPEVHDRPRPANDGKRAFHLSTVAGGRQGRRSSKAVTDESEISSQVLFPSQIERFLPVASDLEKEKFSHLFRREAYHNMSDGHLWFSIFSPIAVNHFTRVQRCTCCFVLLYTQMLLNILYYTQAAQAKNDKSDGLELGPLFISREQV